MSGYESPLEWALRNLLDPNWASERLIDQLSPLSCSMPLTNIYRALTTYQGRLHLTGDKHINIGPLCHGQVPRGQTQQNRGAGNSGDRVCLSSSCAQEWSLNGEPLETSWGGEVTWLSGARHSRWRRLGGGSKFGAFGTKQGDPYGWG